MEYASKSLERSKTVMKPIETIGLKSGRVAKAAQGLGICDQVLFDDLDHREHRSKGCTMPRNL